jgi:hypothetical protein
MSFILQAQLISQHLVRRCLFSKKYNKKHHVAVKIKQKLSIVQEDIKTFNSTCTNSSCHSTLPFTRQYTVVDYECYIPGAAQETTKCKKVFVNKEVLPEKSLFS